MRKPAIEKNDSRLIVLIITQPVSEEQARRLREFLHCLLCCNCLNVVSKIQGQMDKNHTNRPRILVLNLAKFTEFFRFGSCAMRAYSGSMVRRAAGPDNKKCASCRTLPK